MGVVCNVLKIASLYFTLLIYNEDLDTEFSKPVYKPMLVIHACFMTLDTIISGHWSICQNSIVNMKKAKKRESYSTYFRHKDCIKSSSE